MSMPEDRLALIMHLLKQAPQQGSATPADTMKIHDQMYDLGGLKDQATDALFNAGMRNAFTGEPDEQLDSTAFAKGRDLQSARAKIDSLHKVLLAKDRTRAAAPPAADATAVGVPKPPVDTVGVSNRALQSKGALDSIENVPHRSLPVTKNDFGWWDRFEKLLDQNNAQNDTLRQARSGAIPAVPSRNTGKNPVRE